MLPENAKYGHQKLVYTIHAREWYWQPNFTEKSRNTRSGLYLLGCLLSLLDKTIATAFTTPNAVGQELP